MAVSTKVEYEQSLGGGAKFAAGSLAMDSSYTTGGVLMNISNVFSGSPKVFINCGDGYMLEHDQGTVSAGKVVARYSAGNALNGASFIIPLVEVANAANLALVNATWFAMGTMRVDG
jgi:hypothetical protein